MGIEPCSRDNWRKKGMEAPGDPTSKALRGDQGRPPADFLRQSTSRLLDMWGTSRETENQVESIACVVVDAVRVNRSAGPVHWPMGKPLGDLTALPPDPPKLSTICLTHKSGIRSFYARNADPAARRNRRRGSPAPRKLPLTYSNI